MKFTDPKVEWWPQESIAQQIAKVGRICYKAKGKQPPENLSEKERKDFEHKRDMERSKGFWQSGHRSMYRHGTCYFFVPNENQLHPLHIWSLMVASPYIDYVVKGKQVWISTNIQFMCEHEDFQYFLEPYAVDEDAFIEKALKAQCTEALWLLRMTMVVTTQISTSRELNRTSPNVIAEQSTRYCNLKKKSGVQIARPHWYVDATRLQRFWFTLGCKVSSWIYNRLLCVGLPPEDARGVLPLDTYTVVAYTYSLIEWQHILDLRYFGKTGRPHPNAKEVCGQIREIIQERMKQYDQNFTIE